MRSARAREQGSLNVSASARGERGSNRSGGGLALLSLEGAGNRTASSSHLRPLLAPEADAEGGTAATDVDAGDASGRGRGAKSVRFAGSSPTHSTTLSVAEGYAALAGAEASAEPSVHSAAGSAAHNALALVTGTTAEDDAATLSGTSGGSSRASGRYSMRSSRPLSMAISRKAFPVHITFERLGLRLKSDRTRMVLDGVTGGMRPGRICAIMGPSGA
jgi:ABC-type multidrug transport system fused ATPase/permease subunit